MIWLGIVSVILAIISYSLYFRDTFTGRTKPHTITWLVWAALNTFIFIQQLTHDAGPGAWVTGVAAVANLIIFILSFTHGVRTINRLDWFCLIVSIIIMALWLQNGNDELTVVLASAIFVVGFIPTFRKAYTQPHQETITTFALNSLKFFLAVFALNSLTVVTGFYPLVLAITNGAFVVYLLVRRKKVHHRTRKLKRRA